MNITALQRRLQREKLHALLVHQRGQTTLDYYREEGDRSRLFKLNSITKSVMATLIGMAMDQGAISGVHTPLRFFFPLPPEKQQLTLYHLLTMTTGERWPEFGRGVTYPSELTKSADWIQYILRQPLADKPGTRMNYNSGSSHLLSAVLQQATGMSTAAFAEQHLFHPMGIREYKWGTDPQGIPIGGFHLQLRAEDLLKLGLLYLHGGQWEGTQLLSANWIAEAWQPHYTTYRHIGSYGYHWWVLRKEAFDVRFHTYFALGYGGQYVLLVPELELAAVTCGHMPRRGIAVLRMLLDSFS
ncbi:serine hydrolase domain-containing protein [Ectobacillus ponti]|uniref:Beta-lactamase family protein n=1 Tax=Ectobacillus ponti TaxID=2961894 RepID=A0AA42BQZ4_9BACI|nr:serine hydrolase [Ectobacillus ponti]MCP8970780.1 beta-lactamase family protein [Ectobacillus ponti]